MKTSTYWDKRALNRLTEAEKSSDEYIKRVKGIYEQAQRNITRELNSIYANYSNETGVNTQKLKELLTRSETKKTWEQMKRQGLDKYVKDNYKSRISRLEQIQAQIYAKAKIIFPKEEFQNTMCYKGVIHDSYYKTMYDTQRGTGYNFNFSTIDDNMVKALLNDPWSGKNYSKRIWGNTDILANNLSEVIGGGLLSGQSISRTAQQIRERFNVGKYYAERLIRTETNHFNNEADAMAYEELGLDKYVFVATLDSRTSVICQTMDNKVFDFKDRNEGINFPPLHPNCRSKTRAYLGKEEEKLLKRRAKNPITGKTEMVDNVSYEEWLKNITGVDENNKRGYNKDGLLGTGKEYKPNYKKIKGNHSIEDDLKRVNPNFNTKDYSKTKPEWYKNCQRCVPTYEMRRRGYDVEAKPKYQSDIISKKPQVVFKNPDIKHFTQDIENTIIKEMENWGDGSRCQIVSYWKQGGGHTFVAEMEKGKVRFIDPQYGGLDVSNYIKEIKVKDSYFYRIDNLEFTDYIKDCCKGVVKNAGKSTKNSK